MQIGLVYWQQHDETCELIREALVGLGHEIRPLSPNEDLPPALDAVFIQGPSAEHSLIPIARQLLATPGQARPFLIYWLHEGLPNPATPERIIKPASCARAWVRRTIEQAGLAHVQPFALLCGRMARLRYYGDLHWLRRLGLLDVFAVPSRWMCHQLEQREFRPVVAHYGVRPRLGADLKLERDIPVLWFGRPRTRRRRRILEAVRTDLKKRGVEMMFVDGAEHPYAYGEARTRLLNRTKVVLNICGRPWDDNSIRVLMAIMNRALPISEPMPPHNNLMPGIHMVSAAPHRMADEICYYLDHEDERLRIVEAAYDLVTHEMTMECAMRSILARVIELQDQRSRRSFS